MEESILYGVLRTGFSDKVAFEHRPQELKERTGEEGFQAVAKLLGSSWARWCVQEAARWSASLE